MYQIHFPSHSVPPFHLHTPLIISTTSISHSTMHLYQALLFLSQPRPYFALQAALIHFSPPPPLPSSHLRLFTCRTIKDSEPPVLG